MKIAIRATLAVLILLFVFWILSGSGAVTKPPPWLAEHLAGGKRLYESNPVLLIMVFCAAHILSACFSIPGSCTALNVFSGATFGFWRGCLIVYLVTMFSALLGYFAARWLKRVPYLKRFDGSIQRVKERLDKGGFLALVSFRLSPFLPYGVLNMALGLLGVHFWAFFSSTFVGIFFDVVLLNSIGATLASAGTAPVQDGLGMAIVFFALLAVMAIFRKVMSRRLGTGKKS